MRGQPALLFAFLVGWIVSGCAQPPSENDGNEGIGIPQLAFISDRDGTLDIYLTDTEQSFVRQLTQGRGHEYGLAWHPNGMNLAFVSYDSSKMDLYSTSVEDSVWVALTNDPETGDSTPDWSSDGLWLVFASARDHSSGELYLADATGNDVQRLTDNDVMDTAPRFSPDGSKLAFCRQFREERDGESVLNGDIVIMDLTTGSESRITSGLAYDCMPNWSPDGQQIAYHQCGQESGTGCSIHIMEADGSGDRVLVEDGAENTWPDWSPDGTWISYMASVDGDSDIWIIQPDGSNKKAIVTNPGRDEVATWRPMDPAN